MIELDNIEIIRKFLYFGNANDRFYYLEIIQRKKDNPEIPFDRKRYSRFINSIKEFDGIIQDVKDICKFYKARAYISLIPKSKEKFTKACLKEFANRVYTSDYNNTFLIPERLVLSKQLSLRKYWMLDIDDPTPVNEFLNDLDKIDIIKVQLKLKSPSGNHIIVEPFNLADFQNYSGVIRLDAENFDINGKVFTLRPDCLTILYSYLSDH